MNLRTYYLKDKLIMLLFSILKLKKLIVISKLFLTVAFSCIYYLHGFTDTSALGLISSRGQLLKFSIKDFLSKYDQIRKFLRIQSHLLKKSLIENFIFCAVNAGGSRNDKPLTHHKQDIYKVCDALRNLVPFVQFKKREKTHEEVLPLINIRLQPATFLKVTLSHEYFSRFLKCANSTKSRKASLLMFKSRATSNIDMKFRPVRVRVNLT